MVGILGRKIRDIKRTAWRNMPEQVKPYVEYMYRTYGVAKIAAKIPFDYPKSLNRFKFVTSVGRKERISFIPPVFIASICTVCNLRCPNCQYVIKDPAVFKGGGFINVDHFKTVIDKYAKGINIVFLTGGEPLLHPELDDLVQIVKGKGLSVKISTNGILISEKIDTLKSLDFINISLDSYDYQSFRRFRGGTEKQFDKILEGLSLLKKNNVQFMITFVLSEENLEEIYKMIEFAYKVQPSILYFHNINPHGSKDYTPLTLSSKKVNQIMKAIMSKSDYPFDIYLPVIFDTESEHFKTSKCIQPWYYCCFDDKGDISYCCHLGHSRSIGNIFGSYDFDSDMMRHFRRLMIKNEYSGDDCLYCQRRFMGEEYGYFDSKSKKWTCISDEGAVYGN